MAEVRVPNEVLSPHGETAQDIAEYVCEALDVHEDAAVTSCDVHINADEQVTVDNITFIYQ